MTLVIGVIAYYLCWVYRDTIDPNWEERAVKAKWHMEEMDRMFR